MGIFLEPNSSNLLQVGRREMRVQTLSVHTDDIYECISDATSSFIYSLRSKPRVWLVPPFSICLIAMSLLLFVSPGAAVSPPKKRGRSVRPSTFLCPRSCWGVCSASKSPPITAQFRVPLHCHNEEVIRWKVKNCFWA